MADTTPAAKKAEKPSRGVKPETKIGVATLDVKLVEKAVSDADTFLQSQLTSGLAADQRALVFAGFLSAAVAALVAGAASLLSAKEPDWQLIALAMLEGGALLFALGMAILSAKPVPFWYPGNEPSNWTEDLAACRGYHDCMRELLDNLEERIVNNNKILKSNATYMNWALGITFFAIGTGLLLFMAILWQRLLDV